MSGNKEGSGTCQVSWIHSTSGEQLLTLKLLIKSWREVYFEGKLCMLRENKLKLLEPLNLLINWFSSKKLHSMSKLLLGESSGALTSSDRKSELNKEFEKLKLGLLFK